MTTEVPSSQSKKWVCWALAAIVIVGCALRLSRLGRESLWFDEGYSYAIGRLPMGELLGAIKNDTSPPLYYVLLHGWMKAFGESEAAMRSLSAVCSCIGLILTAVIARRALKNSWSVLIATGLSASSFMLLQHGQSMRFYALLAMLGLLAFERMTAMLEKPTIFRAAGLAMALAAALYTNNTMAFYSVGLGLAGLVWPSELTFKKRLLWLVGAFGFAGLLFLPWVPTMLAQMKAIDGAFWIPKPNLERIFDCLTTFTGANANELAKKLPGVGLARNWIVAIVIGGLFLLICAMSLIVVSKENRRKSLALLCAAVVPMAMMLIYSYVKQSIWLDRAMILTGAFAPLILAAPMGWARIPTVIIGITVLMSTRGFLLAERNEPYREVTKQLVAGQQDGDLILFFSHLNKVLYDYYAPRFNNGKPAPHSISLPEEFTELHPPKLKSDLDKSDPTGKLERALATGKYKRVVWIRIHVEKEDVPTIISALQKYGTMTEQTQNRVIFVQYWAIRSISSPGAN